MEIKNGDTEFSLHISTNSSMYIFDEKCIPFSQAVCFYNFIVAQFFLVGYKKSIRKQSNNLQNFQWATRPHAVSAAALRRHRLRAKALPNRADDNTGLHKRGRSGQFRKTTKLVVPTPSLDKIIFFTKLNCILCSDF